MREWQSLTVEEVGQCIALAEEQQAKERHPPYWAHLITLIEAKLKEKNHG